MLSPGELEKRHNLIQEKKVKTDMNNQERPAQKNEMREKKIPKHRSNYRSKSIHINPPIHIPQPPRLIAGLLSHKQHQEEVHAPHHPHAHTHHKVHTAPYASASHAYAYVHEDADAERAHT
jgi:hypothetical protein